MRDMLRLGAFGLVTGSLLVMLYHAPMPVVRELQFVAAVLLLTVATRSMNAQSGVVALTWGMGIVVFLTIGAGALLAGTGLDPARRLGSWAFVPALEEALKLIPVIFGAWIYRRRWALSPNPSDLLMLGCLAGAGFALVENVTLAERGWAPADGYIGHAAATGFIAGGYGLARVLAPRFPRRWWVVAIASAVWIVVEHMLANMYFETPSRIPGLLGRGLLTPWLFAAMAGAILLADLVRARRALAASRPLSLRLRMTRAALLRVRRPAPRSRVFAGRMFLSHVRLVNAAAWQAGSHGAPRRERLL